jgi:hypothetical protein
MRRPSIEAEKNGYMKTRVHRGLCVGTERASDCPSMFYMDIADRWVNLMASGWKVDVDCRSEGGVARGLVC